MEGKNLKKGHKKTHILCSPRCRFKPVNVEYVFPGRITVSKGQERISEHRVKEL